MCVPCLVHELARENPKRLMIAVFEVRESALLFSVSPLFAREKSLFSTSSVVVDVWVRVEAEGEREEEREMRDEREREREVR